MVEGRPMHFEEEAIQRWLHGEVEPPDREVMDGHLATCGECRGVLEQAQRDDHWIRGRLKLLDHPIPVISAPSHRRSGSSWQRWAAGILLTVAVAGAAYAFPGSPVRSWIARLTAPRGPEAPPSPAAPAAPVRPSAISVPLESRLVIRFGQSEPGSVIRVRLTEGREVTVSSLDGPATFTTGPGWLSVGGQGEYLVELPRAATWVAIEAGDQRLLLKEGDRISSSLAADSTGEYVLHTGTPR
jgi:hypothetical protein